mgnify:CR=1 FL=1
MAIDKEFKTIDEQVLLLKSRNLQFNDEQAAKELLKKYNYFDIINGISGDMTIATLLDLGVSKDIFLEEIKKLKMVCYYQYI